MLEFMVGYALGSSSGKSSKSSDSEDIGNISIALLLTNILAIIFAIFLPEISGKITLFFVDIFSDVEIYNNFLLGGEIEKQSTGMSLGSAMGIGWFMIKTFIFTLTWIGLLLPTFFAIERYIEDQFDEVDLSYVLYFSIGGTILSNILTFIFQYGIFKLISYKLGF